MLIPAPNKRSQIIVRAGRTDRCRGIISFGPLNFQCALGRSGVRMSKREGDGATPAGHFRLQKILYNASRVRRPRSALPIAQIRAHDGWCDAPGDRNYNRQVRHPYGASAERLWREDELYDIIVVTDHNQRPCLRGRGSAIFIHVARDDYGPTGGCIALRRADLLRLLARLPRACAIAIALK